MVDAECGGFLWRGILPGDREGLPGETPAVKAFGHHVLTTGELLLSAEKLQQRIRREGLPPSLMGLRLL